MAAIETDFSEQKRKETEGASHIHAEEEAGVGRWMTVAIGARTVSRRIFVTGLKYSCAKGATHVHAEDEERSGTLGTSGCGWLLRQQCSV